MKKKTNLYKNHGVSFISSNIHKFQEIRAIFEQNSQIQVSHIKKHLSEIQSDSLEKIAMFSLKNISINSNKKYYFVEDSGLFIKSLNGFPGPYSSYVFKKVGNKGILGIMKSIELREAFFQSTIALRANTEIITFTGVVRGCISEKISEFGWGYDPIFIADSHFPDTLGDLGKKKDTISHRYNSTKKLIKYLECDPNFYKF